MTSRKKLIAAQLANYPDSQILSAQVVLNWAGDNATRLRAVALTIQVPGGVWYWIPRIGKSEVTGYRYGVAGHKYISGFSDM